MKTKKLFIVFGAVTAFEVGCKSAASRGCRRATGWQATEAKMETEKAAPNVRESFQQMSWSVVIESRLEREVTPNRVETKILAERSL
jgi:hypothetical protein